MEENELSKSNFVLTDESESFLKETAKWAYLLSIIGFVFLGILLIFVMSIGAIFSKIGNMGGGMPTMIGMGTGIFSTIYITIALVYFFPIFYLYQFASKAKKAFKNNDNEELNRSFKYLKSHYKFIGVVTLIFVVFYGIIFFFTFLFGLFSIF